MSIEACVTDDVLGTVSELLAPLVGDLDVLDIQITRDTAFHEDLGLESIDLVTFAGILAEHYGPDVDLAEFLSQKDLDEVIELRIGDITDFVAKRLAERG
ncbi:MAG TPA: acyl carrier protein [Pseudonocardiaceae bacterium]|jgi:acyl carrier protein|nr:acyl carrier protein [Pseudonocardiaceae bacterium]